MKKILLTLIIIVSILSFGFRPKEKRVLDLKSKYGFYVVELVINGKKGNFLVDTGAVTSIIDISQYKKYDFKYHTTQTTFVGVGGHASRYSVSGYNISYQEDELDIYLQGMDMSKLINSFGKKNIHIIGIIGSSYLRSVDAQIDYGNNQLTVYE